MKVYDSSATEPTETPRPDRLKVGIAEFEVSTNGAVLTTSGLGSCIGVALCDADAGVAGLAHVMMPSADEVENGEAAKFADTGTELLLAEMEAAGADLDAIEAKIAGGSDMLDFSENGVGIGQRNAETVRETLAAHDVPVVAEDVGGDHGRSLRLEADSGDLVVKSANEGAVRL